MEIDNKLASFEDFKSMYEKYFNEKELELIKIACETHDLGKMNYKFQKKIYKSINQNFEINNYLEKLYKELNIEEIPHGILSCAFLNINELEEKFSEDEIKALSSAIYNHHTRKALNNNGLEISSTDIKTIVDNDIAFYKKIYNDKLKCRYLGVSMNVIKENYNPSYDIWKNYIIIKFFHYLFI